MRPERLLLPLAEEEINSSGEINSFGSAGILVGAAKEETMKRLAQKTEHDERQRKKRGDGAEKIAGKYPPDWLNGSHAFGTSASFNCACQSIRHGFLFSTAGRRGAKSDPVGAKSVINLFER